MAKHAEPKYGEKNWKRGFNSRGLPSKTIDQVEIPVSTERGKRRHERDKKGETIVHEHTWIRYAPDEKNSSYNNPQRVENETRFYCKDGQGPKQTHKRKTKNATGRTCGRHQGCGATCREIK